MINAKYKGFRICEAKTIHENELGRYYAFQIRDNMDIPSFDSDHIFPAGKDCDAQREACAREVLDIYFRDEVSFEEAYEAVRTSYPKTTDTQGSALTTILVKHTLLAKPWHYIIFIVISAIFVLFLNLFLHKKELVLGLLPSLKLFLYAATSLCLIKFCFSAYQFFKASRFVKIQEDALGIAFNSTYHPTLPQEESDWFLSTKGYNGNGIYALNRNFVSKYAKQGTIQAESSVDRYSTASNYCLYLSYIDIQGCRRSFPFYIYSAYSQTENIVELQERFFKWLNYIEPKEEIELP